MSPHAPDPGAARDHATDQPVPRHIAIVMDGNGRWARQRGLPRTAGHRAGAKAVREVLEGCRELGVEVLTLYSFSSENWKRPAEEIDALMTLCVEYCRAEAEALRRNDIRVRVIGRRRELPESVREALDLLEQQTAPCTGATLCLAINYGSHAEILDAARSLARDAAAGLVDPDAVSEQDFADRLYTAGLPAPDLFIRTGGGFRLSNFLLWQLSYAELIVVDTLWPDFDRAGLRDAVAEFSSRERRFGGLGEADTPPTRKVGG